MSLAFCQTEYRQSNRTQGMLIIHRHLLHHRPSYPFPPKPRVPSSSSKDTWLVLGVLPAVYAWTLILFQYSTSVRPLQVSTTKRCPNCSVRERDTICWFFLPSFFLLSTLWLMKSVTLHINLQLQSRIIAPSNFFWGMHILDFVVVVVAVITAATATSSAPSKDEKMAKTNMPVASAATLVVAQCVEAAKAIGAEITTLATAAALRGVSIEGYLERYCSPRDSGEIIKTVILDLVIVER